MRAATSTRISPIFLCQLVMSLDTVHHSSPCRGSAFSQRFLTSSCCSWGRDQTGLQVGLLLGYPAASPPLYLPPPCPQDPAPKAAPSPAGGAGKHWVLELPKAGGAPCSTRGQDTDRKTLRACCSALPQCHAAAQTCRRKPRHPPGLNQSSLCGGTTPGPW